jgi:hypothetical protein
MPSFEMEHPRTMNPAGNTKYRLYDVQPPSRAVVQKQDPSHTEQAYLRDLGKVTKRQPRRSS